MLTRLAYLSVTNAFALPRLPPIDDHDKDIDILLSRHQITVLERQLDKARPRFSSRDRAFLTALLHRLPAEERRRSDCWNALKRCFVGTAPPSRAATQPDPAPNVPATLGPYARTGSSYCAWHGRIPPRATPHPRRTTRPRHQGRCVHRRDASSFGGTGTVAVAAGSVLGVARVDPVRKPCRSRSACEGCGWMKTSRRQIS